MLMLLLVAAFMGVIVLIGTVFGLLDITEGRAFRPRGVRRAPGGNVSHEVEVVVALAAHYAVEAGTKQIAWNHLVRAALHNDETRECFQGRVEQLNALRLVVAGDTLNALAPRTTTATPPVEHDIVRAFELAREAVAPRSVTLGGVLEELRKQKRLLHDLLPDEIRFVDSGRFRATDRATADADYVYILNDDHSPMADVRSLLAAVFSVDEERALYPTLCIHYHGFVSFGPMSSDIAVRMHAAARKFADELGLCTLRVCRSLPDAFHSSGRRAATQGG